MMDKQQVLDWIDTLPEGSGIAIDNGGLALVEVDAHRRITDAYLEIGMTPDEEDEIGDGGTHEKVEDPR